MKYIYVCIGFLLILPSCNKKTIYNQVSNTPVFKFSGLIDTANVNIQAGVNNIYMYTNCFKDSQNLWTLYGAFAPDSCTSCDPYLSFEVKDIETSNGSTLATTYAEILAKQVFTSYSLDSVMQNTPVEVFTFKADSLNPASTTYKWYFGDGDSSSLKNPTHIFPLVGSRDVQLITTFNGDKDSLTNTIDANYNSSCRIQFNTSVDSQIVNVVAPPGFTDYLWDFGIGNTFNGQTTSYTYPSLPSIYTIALTAVSPACTSNISFKKRVAILPQSGLYSLANYSYTTALSNQITFQPRINKNAFIITYRNNGKEYRSYKSVKSINQSSQPIFTLENFTLYQLNTNNQNTLYIKGKVDAFLYNISNPSDSIKIRSNNLEFAIAFPK